MLFKRHSVIFKWLKGLSEVFLKKDMFKRFVNYIKDSSVELKKVSWPTKKQAVNSTALVVGVSLAVALFLGLIDFLLTEILQIIL